jgi:hypothetical protein
MSELHVVALSGGKDSVCMALLLKEREPRDYVYICTPTGDELPEMYEHWKMLGSDNMLGKPILPVMAGTLEGMVEQERMIPSFHARWCTRRLKIEPYAAWLMQQQKKHDRIISYVGLRADEEEREGGDYSNVPGVERRFPLREWGMGLADVLEALDVRGVTIPARTDCARCWAQTLGEWWNLWRLHLAIYLDAEAQELRHGHSWRSPQRDTQPTFLRDLRAKFENGYIPRGSDVQPDLFRKGPCRVCRL